MKRSFIVKFLVVVLVLSLGLVAIPSILGAITINGEYDSHSGDIYLYGAGTIEEAVADPGDGKFIQMDVGSWIILKFPGDYVAEPDGTAAADLRIVIYDALYPANAEISVSLDGSTWTVIGEYPDTANIDIDLEGIGAVKYVKVDQNLFYIDPLFPGLGFDLDAIVALNAVISPPDITPGTKAEILINSGVMGIGLATAPGLQKQFNPNSRAAERAGKK